VPGSATSTTITLAATANARYIIEARARNGLGAVGPWVVYPLDVVVGSLASNINARLSQASITLAANADGVVASYTGASTTVQILVDGNDTAHLWTKTRTNSSGITSTLVGSVLTVLDVDAGTNSGFVDILCTRGGFADIPLRFGISKAKGGLDGAGNITWTTRGGVVMNGTTATKTGGDNAWDGEVASVQGFAGGCYVAFTAAQTVGNVFVGLNADPTSAPDYQSIDYAFLLQDGVLYIFESGSNVANLGAFTVGQRFELRHRGGQITYFINGASVRSVALADSTVLYADCSIYNVGYRVENLVFGPIGATGAQGPAGYNSATVTIYKRSSTTPSGPTADVTYTFATKALSGLDSGWSTAWPGGTEPVWARVASFASTGATDTAAPGEWTAPQVVAQNGTDGDDGDDGLNVATVYLDQRTSSATPPALPSANVTYTFAGGAISGANNGWLASQPSTGGKYSWVTQATAASAAATDTIPPSEWAAAGLIAQDGNNGNNGADGGYTDYRFIRSATAPSTPTGDAPAGWSDGPPAGTAPLYFIKGAKTAAGVLVGAWSTPARLDGDSTVAEYSEDGVSGWHSTATATDKYMRTKTGDGAWQGPFRIVAEDAGPVSRAIPKLYAEHYAVNPATATAGIRFKPDGRRQIRSGATWVDTINWHYPTTTGVGSGWHIRRTHISGTVPGGGGTMTAGTWLALTSDRDVLMSQTADGNTTCTEFFELSNDGGTTVYASGEGVVNVTRATES
jgi:hypothetical protein